MGTTNDANRLVRVAWPITFCCVVWGWPCENGPDPHALDLPDDTPGCSTPVSGWSPDGFTSTATATERRNLGGFIRTQRQMANLWLRQLCALAKVSNPYLSQVERGLHDPSVRVPSRSGKR